nr:A-kinase anchor protein inhibitor 1 isoform X1 [Microcebus murinus]
MLGGTAMIEDTLLLYSKKKTRMPPGPPGPAPSGLASFLQCYHLPPLPGEKPGNEPEEVKLQNASKQIVQRAILQAVRQVSRESRREEERTSDNPGSFQLGVGELTKKHEKK